jgi:hypothetical protein
MKARFLRLLLPVLLLAALTARGLAAVTIHVSVDPQELSIGDEATITYDVQGGDVQDFRIPDIDGLNVEGSSTSARFVMNGFSVSQSVSHSFLVVANRAGTFVIPPLKLRTGDNQTVTTQSITLHVVGGNASTPSATPPPSSPVVTPPDQSDGTTQATTPSPGGSISVPTEPDGRASPVFDIITPATTTAYVGQSVPLHIDSYIRVDSNADQDSLPTLVGSDFLMNNLSLQPNRQGVNLGDMEYIRDGWTTAISAPKAGDFPLQAVRDTYWTKSGPPIPNDPFGPLFGRQSQLVHKEIPSNKLVMHVLPLPDEGKPAGFTGAIGQFQVSGAAEPATVGVGEPITLRFVITGTGNFDYVRPPALANDPAWKTYIASSKTNYSDEAHTQGTKSFEQAIIPQKNGVLALPAARFSYFDPDKKQYITLPVTLPPIVVTGTPVAPATLAAAPASAADATASPANPPVPSTQFAPNKLTFGALTPDLAPSYRRAWFWIVQAVLALLVVVGVALSMLRPRQDPTRGDRARRQASLVREEAAMDQAARDGDAVQFFTSARRATQLRLAERWNIPAEAVTLPEIERRDPALAETVTPLFVEADDVIYSGAARAGLDLQEWSSRVREMIQPVRL